MGTGEVSSGLDRSRRGEAALLANAWGQTSRGAKIPGCAGPRATNSAIQRANLQSQLRWTGTRESARLQAIHAQTRNLENARSSFEGRPRRELDRHQPRLPRLPDRACLLELRPRWTESRSSALFGAVLSGSRDQCQRRPGSESSSKPG